LPPPEIPACPACGDDEQCQPCDICDCSNKRATLLQCKHFVDGVEAELATAQKTIATLEKQRHKDLLDIKALDLENRNLKADWNSLRNLFAAVIVVLLAVCAVFMCIWPRGRNQKSVLPFFGPKSLHAL